MSEQCGRGFDPALLSGWIDGALRQADEQRVRSPSRGLWNVPGRR